MSDKLILAMKEKIPKGSSLVSFLMDALSMGKEAVYRRLRNEVSFTFEEATLISSHLNISLDKIAGNLLSEEILFDITISNVKTNIEAYYDSLVNHCKLYEELIKDPNLSFWIATNTLPYIFISEYETIMRYRICKWAYHKEQIMLPDQLPEEEIPQKIWDKQRELTDLMRKIKKARFIFDRNVFSSFIRDIKYSAELNLIRPNDLEKIKLEFKTLLNKLELFALKGNCEGTIDTSIYISSIDFDSSYIYLETSGKQMSMLPMFSLNLLTTSNSQFCEIQKDWIDSLRRHSILISQSGEIQRMTYFNKQRKLLDSL